MRGWMEKLEKSVPGDATPPTLSTEYVLIMEKIDVHEGCNVRIRNIRGDFLSADMEEDVKMALYGRLEELMLNIAPQIYRHHVIHEKGSLVLYINLKKVLYSCLI